MYEACLPTEVKADQMIEAKKEVPNRAVFHPYKVCQNKGFQRDYMAQGVHKSPPERCNRQGGTRE